ncbi:branched-chain amino acid ABC transporter permease [Solirubrobacter ginsenosidimutans]|uniref:Branched-chain amino acid ABC transporter permease n=1 Tax=Solirubrobacter ginsenosidimutans TaxID=490573 RepID=A0A9X3RYZ5_9ACTN|nr:branched-chain amino acid ABC transporter permease [Solirubrobacter ginsenosidimutans]MDA0160350.1 branched-chain amino acid ABC transporter permease [Solirubrobacter ginsenosidimutans]
MEPIFHMLVYGGLYGLVAVSFNVLYRPTNVFNFAQGQFVAIGALLAAALLKGGVPWVIALVIALLAVGALSLLVETTAVAPVLSRSATSHTWLITTLAVSLILDDLAAKIFGGEAQPVAVPAPLSSDYLIRVGDTGLSSYDLLVIVVPVLVVIGLAKLYATRPGRAISAIAEDRQGAVLRGIDPVLLTRVSWFVGGALAALAGVLAGPIMYASVSLGPSLLITGFAAVAIGGVGDNRGAMAGGYLLALVEGLTAARIAADLTDVATFVVLLLVLLVKPTGLFGERQVARV